MEHCNDHLQFPGVICKAIEKKNEKKYEDLRTLIVAFSADDSLVDDLSVKAWVREIKKECAISMYKKVLLVEVEDKKVFPVQ